MRYSDKYAKGIHVPARVDVARLGVSIMQGMFDILDRDIRLAMRLVWGSKGTAASCLRSSKGF